MRVLKLNFTWDLPFYSARCALIKLETLENRRKHINKMFVCDILTYKIKIPEIFAILNRYAPERALAT